MSLYDSNGNRVPQKIEGFLESLLDGKNIINIQVDEFSSLIENEKKELEEEYRAWQNTVRDLRALPNKDFFLGKGVIRVFDIERRIETDTDKAKVIIYDIYDKSLFNAIKRYRADKIFITLKLISPRVMEQLVSVRRFYEKMIQLCDYALDYFKSIKGSIIKNAENKNSEIGQQHNRETGPAAS